MATRAPFGGSHTNSNLGSAGTCVGTCVGGFGVRTSLTELS